MGRVEELREIRIGMLERHFEGDPCQASQVAPTFGTVELGRRRLGAAE